MLTSNSSRICSFRVSVWTRCRMAGLTAVLICGRTFPFLAISARISTSRRLPDRRCFLLRQKRISRKYPPSADHVPAGIAVDRLAGDGPALVAGQEQGEVGDVFGL